MQPRTSVGQFIFIIEEKHPIIQSFGLIHQLTIHLFYGKEKKNSLAEILQKKTNFNLLKQKTIQSMNKMVNVVNSLSCQCWKLVNIFCEHSHAVQSHLHFSISSLCPEPPPLSDLWQKAVTPALTPSDYDDGRGCSRGGTEFPHLSSREREGQSLERPLPPFSPAACVCKLRSLQATVPKDSYVT